MRKIILIISVFLFNIIWVNALTFSNKIATKYNLVINTNKATNLENNTIINEIDYMTNPDLVFEKENADKIGEKIDIYLKNEIEGYGNLISRYSIINEVNPYLIASIILEGTKCSSKCSILVTRCNNVYEAEYDKKNLNQTSCFGGYYRKFNSIDESIKSFIRYIKNNYYVNDLKTPSSMAKKYEKDVRWVYNINQNIVNIKNAEV